MTIVETVMEAMPWGTEAVVIRSSAHASDTLGRSRNRVQGSLGDLSCVRRLEQAGGAEAVTAQDAAGQALRSTLGVIEIRRGDVDARAEAPGRTLAHAWPMPHDVQVLLLIADSVVEDNISIPGELPRNAAGELLMRFASHGGIGQIRADDLTRLVRKGDQGSRLAEAARQGRCRILAATVEADLLAPNCGPKSGAHAGTAVSQ